MEAGPRTVRQKRLAPNQQVSGAVGEFIDTGPSKRRCRERWFGHVFEAVGERKYLVRFDNGQEKELPSNVLKVEDMVATLPPDVLLPIPQNVRELTNLENAEADLLDVEESEDLPTVITRRRRS
jgi:hypothetical protein